MLSLKAEALVKVFKALFPIFIRMSRQTYIVFLFLFISALSSAQIIPFKNYTVRDGLPSNSINDVLQDKKGYMWFATDIGLTRFDGYNFKTFTIVDGLSDNYVNCLTLDMQGRIWAGTETGGVTMYSDSAIKNFGANVGLIDEPIDYIFVDSNNRVWACGAQLGVSMINGGKVESFDSENSDLTSNVFSYYIDSKGMVWLGTYEGLFYYDGTLKQYSLEQLNFTSIWDIIEDESNRLWIATETEGVVCIDSNTISLYNTENGLLSNTTLSLQTDSLNRIYIGTYYGGIHIIENEEVKYDLINQTQDYWIWDLYRDSKNRIWARSQEQGIILITDNSIKAFSIENNLINQYIRGTFEDSFGNIWFSSEDGISLYGKVVFENISEGFVNDDTHILSISISEKNNIYTGSYSGLTEFKSDGVIEQFAFRQGFSIEEPVVQKILIDSNNNKWIATSGLAKLKNNKISLIKIKELENQDYSSYVRDLVFDDNVLYGATEIGLLAYNTINNSYALFNSEDGMISDDVYSLSVDEYGRIWCGTSSGLSIYKKDTIINFSTFEGLPNSFCNDIAFDERGIAWIGTDHGLCAAVFDEHKFLSTKNYFIEDGLKSNAIVSVAVDKNNNLWLGHYKGVDMFNPRTKEFKNYGFDEGFLPIENNLGAITNDANGHIWFGTINGIVKYSPENDLKNTQAPNIYINAIQLYNDTSSIDNYYTRVNHQTGLPSDLKLHHSKENLYFEYVGLHYTIVEKNTYQYRLLGYDESWSEPTTDIQSIPYQKLPHGKYTFQVKAANCDGVWTEKPAEFSFEILPPFWKTWWFRVVEIVVGILLLYLFVYFRERKLRHDKKVLANKVKVRTREVVEQKDQIEKQHDEIARQKKEITDSIHYAQHIQSAILPKDETVGPLLRDYFILYKPRDIVSGDFYWIHGINGKVIAIAADCTGHGVPGAFMSMLGVSILNEIATGNDKLNAGKILDTLREHIINTLSHTGQDEEARDGMDLALSIIDFENKKLEFAGAYNPLWIIRNGELEAIKPNKMPVGLHAGEMVPFDSTELDLQSNDCIYMFSDGYADQFGGPEGKKFKTGTFKRLLLEIAENPMREQHDILDKTIQDWMENQEQVDDILVMGIRIN